MTRRRVLIPAMLCLLGGPAFGKDLPPRQAEEPQKNAKACAYLGKGYIRAEGSDTCIKVSGSVRVEGSVTSRR